MIPHNRPTIGAEEKEAALRVLNSGWIAQGDEVRQFENEFCEYLGLPEGHAVCVSSGTAALYLALWAVNAKNKKIGMPVYVCSSLRHATALVGGIEVLIDIEKDSPNINIEDLNTHLPDIAIIPHLYGLPVDISKINKSIIVIEDCAQSLGAKLFNEHTGLHGELGIFSFYATKLITSGGQGGMVVSKKKELIELIRDYREFDCRHDWKTRFNFQMTDLQAAIGRAQLKKLPDFLYKREIIFKKYRDSGINLLDVKYHNNLAPIRYRAILKTKNPKNIISALSKEEIQAIIPIEDWELLGDKRVYINAYNYALESVSFPCYPSLTFEEQNKIIKVFQNL